MEEEKKFREILVIFEGGLTLVSNLSGPTNPSPTMLMRDVHWPT